MRCTVTGLNKSCCSGLEPAAIITPDSDYDVAIFLREFEDRSQEVKHIIPIVTDILYEEEEFIHAMPYRAGAFNDRTPLMSEVRREGLDL